MLRYTSRKSALLSDCATASSVLAEEGRSIRDLLPAAGLFAIFIVILSIAYLRGAGDKGQYLVVAPPGSSLAGTINLVVSADGRLVRTGVFPNMLFAASKRADFQTALRAAGAWLVIPSPIPMGCSGEATDGRSA